MFAEGMFCAGGDGIGPCQGDSGTIIFTFGLKFIFFFILSGGGFFVQYHGLWTLRGVVSSGTLRTDGGCDVDRYTLFTNVLDYTAWIDDAVKKNATSPSEKECKVIHIRFSIYNLYILHLFNSYVADTGSVVKTNSSEAIRVEFPIADFAEKKTNKIRNK